MIRVFPMRRASRAWPSALLSLWAPVWQRSSRFRWIWAPPKWAVSRSAAYRGVGRPTKACCWARSSRMISGSTHTSPQAPSSSSSAAISVSGTYWPPYGPNLPSSFIGDLYSLHESAHQIWVLESHRRLDAARNVHPKWPVRPHDVRDVVRGQAPRDDHPAVG